MSRLTVTFDSLLVSLNLNSLTFQTFYFSVFFIMENALYKFLSYYTIIITFNFWRRFHYVSRLREFFITCIQTCWSVVTFYTQLESTVE